MGDAVGADPIFGEGISIALGYGKLAAREISESIQRNEFSFDGFKRRVVRSALGSNIDRTLDHYAYHLSDQVALVPNPGMADIKADRHIDRMGLCFELGQTAVKACNLFRFIAIELPL